MAKSDTKSGSILGAVARHEQELVARLEAARRDAEGVIAQARADAARLREEARQRLEQDAVDMRRKAEAAREEQRIAQQKAAEAELERRRAEANGRAPDVVKEIVSLVLPRHPEGPL